MLQFEDLDHDAIEEQPRFTGSSWRNGRIPPRCMKIIGPLGELGVRQRAPLHHRKSTPRKDPRQIFLADAEFSKAESNDRPNSAAPLLQPSLHKRKVRHQEGPSMQHLNVLDRLHEESCIRRKQLAAERGPPLAIETVQEWDSEHQHDRKEISKLHEEHGLIQEKITAQAEGINRLIEQRTLDTERHIDEIASLVAQHEKVLFDMNSQHTTALARVIESGEEQIAAERAKHVEEVAACHQRYRQIELDITARYEQRISDVTSRYEERAASTAKYHEWQMKDQLDKFRNQASKLTQEAEQIEQMEPIMEDDVAGKFQAQMEEMERTHQIQLDEIRRDRDVQLAALQAECEAKLTKGTATAVPHSEALEKTVKSLTQDVARWRHCAEEASQAATNYERELKVMEQRYEEMKLQLIHGAQDEVRVAKEASNAAAVWERKFLELQSQYDLLKLQGSQRGQDHEQAVQQAVSAAQEARAAADYWEQQFQEVQSQYDILQLQSTQIASNVEKAGENDISLQAPLDDHRSQLDKLMKENNELRQRISDLESGRATASTAASTPAPDINRSSDSTPQPQFAGSSATSPALTQDAPQASSSSAHASAPSEEDLAGLSYSELQKVMGDLSTEDLMRMAGRS
eukprot:gnl/MRDRNA2_/MRDRNA2_31042_c0_seq1.p1 gnl/MRDRNA2_/MRDRNA2_31042_c0~~gnl/MRDRNA2_/MRDRNA2_31042_c0_seq1.p1  ORF type:complete len:631 (-),score=178.51 gnl/MRDRNA2_/MRDRNA2_31042_c0_seq1:92-1984(-)